MPEAQKASHAQNLSQSALVKDMARATGVGVGEVAKVLEHLGVARVLDLVVRATGKEPAVTDVRVAFSLGGGNVLVAT